MQLKYWCIKYIFLRWSTRPPTWDQTLNDWINKVLPFGLVLHLSFALWFYSADDIFYPKFNSNWFFPESIFKLPDTDISFVKKIDTNAQKHLLISL